VTYIGPELTTAEGCSMSTTKEIRARVTV